MTETTETTQETSAAPPITDDPKSPFQYTIRNREIAKELEEAGFVVWHPSPDGTVMQGPADLSATQARKMIGLMINLYLATKDLDRAQRHYDKAVNAFNAMNSKRNRG